MKAEQEILTELEGLGDEKEYARKQAHFYNTQIATLKKRKGVLLRELNEVRRHEKLTKIKDLTVSDHAFVRYLQRVGDIDFTDLKESILSEELIETFKNLSLKDVKITINGIIYVIKDSKIVTIMLESAEPNL